MTLARFINNLPAPAFPDPKKMVKPKPFRCPACRSGIVIRFHDYYLCKCGKRTDCPPPEVLEVKTRDQWIP